MGLFSFLSKNKQNGGSGSGAEFYSRAEGQAKPRGRKRKEGKADADKAIDDEPLGPVLPEKKRARRRLVGAVALVLAMIIGLPMLLDKEQKPVSDDIAIQIPSRDKPPTGSDAAPVQTTTMQPAPSPASSASASAPTVANPAPTAGPAAAAPAPAAVAPPVEARSKPAESAVADKPAKPEKPNDKATDKVAEKPADKPQDKDTAKTSQKPADKQEARAEAILEGKDVDGAKSDKSDKKAGHFIVQVAALTSKEKITELQGKLTDAGFKPLLQTVPTDAGVTTRVRVGPFASKEEAETARAKLAKLGLNGKLLPL